MSHVWAAFPGVTVDANMVWDPEIRRFMALVRDAKWGDYIIMNQDSHRHLTAYVVLDHDWPGKIFVMLGWPDVLTIARFT